MSTEIETPFKVETTYKKENGSTGRIVAIVPELNMPLLVYTNEQNIERYSAEGRWSPCGKCGRDLIPPKTLPPLPTGREWHRPEAVTQEMIDEGWRPLLEGDECLGLHGWDGTGLFGLPITEGSSNKYRTKRPLPPAKKRVPLGPEDVPPGSVIRRRDWPKGWQVITACYQAGLSAGGASHRWEAVMDGIEILVPGGEWKPMWKEEDA